MLMDGRAGGLATDHGLRLDQTSTTVEWPAADGGTRGLTSDQYERRGRHRTMIRENRLNLFQKSKQGIVQNGC
jgi:hypothetical protein